MANCSCNKHRKHSKVQPAQVAGLEDANWSELMYTIAGGVAGQLVNGALGQIEKLDDKHGAKAVIKGAASLGLIGFVDGDWSTPLGAGMLVETGITFLRESDILSNDDDATSGVGRVYTY